MAVALGAVMVLRWTLRTLSLVTPLSALLWVTACGGNASTGAHGEERPEGDAAVPDGRPNIGEPGKDDPGQVERGAPWQDADDCEPRSPRSEEPRMLTGAFTELQGVEVVRGDLTLMLTSASPASLPDLKQVHGKIDSLSCPRATSLSLTLERTALRELSLPFLRSGGVWLTHNAQLTQVTLPQFEGDSFHATDHARLTSVALPSMTRAHSLFLTDASRLTSLELPMLNEVQVELSIERTGLTSIALPSLVTGAQVRLLTNQALTSLNLEGLKEARGFALTGSSVTQLALPALESVYGLELEYNWVLETLSLPSLTGLVTLVAKNDPALSQCAMEALAQQSNASCDCTQNLSCE